MAESRLQFLLTAKDGTADAFRRVSSGLRNLQDSAARINAAFGTLGGVLGSAFAGATFTAFIKGTVNSLDKLNDLKDATGASIENISALEDVAARTGTSFDTVGTALVKLNKVLADAEPGSETERVLKSIGLSAKELRVLDPAEALQRTAVALSKYADDGNKARIVSALFGKSIKEVAPLLEELSKTGKLVATVTTKQAEEAEKLNKQFSELEKNSVDLARSLVKGLVPAMNEVLQARKELGFFGALATALGADKLAIIEGQLVNAERRVKEAQQEFENAAKGDFGVFDSLFGTPESRKKKLDILQIDLKLAQAEVQRIERALETAKFKGVEDRGFIPERPKAPDIASKAKAAEISEAQRALAAYVQQLDKQGQALDQLSERQQALNFLQSLGTAGEIPQVRELVLLLADRNDKTKDAVELEKERLEIQNKAIAASKQLDEAINQFTGRTDDARKRALTEQLEARLAAGEIFSPEELEKAVKGIGGITDAVHETKSAAEELGLTFASAFEDAIVSGKALSEVIRGLEQDILRMVTRELVTKPLADFIGSTIKGFGGSGGGADFIGKAASAIGGFFGFKAGGGTVPSGGWAIAGERGPEIITGPARVTPLGQIGGTTVINVTVPPGTDARSAHQLGAIVAQRLAISSARNN